MVASSGRTLGICIGVSLLIFLQLTSSWYDSLKEEEEEQQTQLQGSNIFTEKVKSKKSTRKFPHEGIASIPMAKKNRRNQKQKRYPRNAQRQTVILLDSGGVVSPVQKSASSSPLLSSTAAEVSDGRSSNSSLLVDDEDCLLIIRTSTGARSQFPCSKGEGSSHSFSRGEEKEKGNHMQIEETRRRREEERSSSDPPPMVKPEKELLCSDSSRCELGRGCVATHTGRCYPLESSSPATTTAEIVSNDSGGGGGGGRRKVNATVIKPNLNLAVERVFATNDRLRKIWGGQEEEQAASWPTSTGGTDEDYLRCTWTYQSPVKDRKTSFPILPPDLQDLKRGESGSTKNGSSAAQNAARQLVAAREEVVSVEYPSTTTPVDKGKLVKKWTHSPELVTALFKNFTGAATNHWRDFDAPIVRMTPEEQKKFQMRGSHKGPQSIYTLENFCIPIYGGNFTGFRPVMEEVRTRDDVYSYKGRDHGNIRFLQSLTVGGSPHGVQELANPPTFYIDRKIAIVTAHAGLRYGNPGHGVGVLGMMANLIERHWPRPELVAAGMTAGGANSKAVEEASLEFLNLTSTARDDVTLMIDIHGRYAGFPRYAHLAANSHFLNFRKAGMRRPKKEFLDADMWIKKAAAPEAKHQQNVSKQFLGGKKIEDFFAPPGSKGTSELPTSQLLPSLLTSVCFKEGIVVHACEMQDCHAVKDGSLPRDNDPPEARNKKNDDEISKSLSQQKGRRRGAAGMMQREVKQDIYGMYDPRSKRVEKFITARIRRCTGLVPRAPQTPEQLAELGVAPHPPSRLKGKPAGDISSALSAPVILLAYRTANRGMSDNARVVPWLQEAAFKRFGPAAKIIIFESRNETLRAMAEVYHQADVVIAHYGAALYYGFLMPRHSIMVEFNSAILKPCPNEGGIDLCQRSDYGGMAVSGQRHHVQVTIPMNSARDYPISSMDIAPATMELVTDVVHCLLEASPTSWASEKVQNCSFSSLEDTSYIEHIVPTTDIAIDDKNNRSPIEISIAGERSEKLRLLRSNFIDVASDRSTVRSNLVSQKQREFLMDTEGIELRRHIASVAPVLPGEFEEEEKDRSARRFSAKVKGICPFIEEKPTGVNASTDADISTAVCSSVKHRRLHYLWDHAKTVAQAFVPLRLLDSPLSPRLNKIAVLFEFPEIAKYLNRYNGAVIDESTHEVPPTPSHWNKLFAEHQNVARPIADAITLERRFYAKHLPRHFTKDDGVAIFLNGHCLCANTDKRGELCKPPYDFVIRFDPRVILTGGQTTAAGRGGNSTRSGSIKDENDVADDERMMMLLPSWINKRMIHFVSHGKEDEQGGDSDWRLPFLTPGGRFLQLQ